MAYFLEFTGQSNAMRTKVSMAVNSSCECRGENRRSSRTLARAEVASASAHVRHRQPASRVQEPGDQVVTYNPYIEVKALYHQFSSTLHSQYTFVSYPLRTLHSKHGWRTITIRWPDRRRHRRRRRTGKGICTLLRFTRSQCRGQ
jgi:hypothetical protein